MGNDKQAIDHLAYQKDMILESMAKIYSETIANGHNYRDLECGFKDGYKQAKTEVQNEIYELIEAARQLIHLHSCEQEGIASGQPTPAQWLQAVDNLSNAINYIDLNK